jgi:hypothetical protein
MTQRSLRRLGLEVLESDLPTRMTREHVPLFSLPTLITMLRILDLVVLFSQCWVHTAVNESLRVSFIYR